MLSQEQGKGWQTRAGQGRARTSESWVLSWLSCSRESLLRSISRSPTTDAMAVCCCGCRCLATVCSSLAKRSTPWGVCPQRRQAEMTGGGALLGACCAGLGGLENRSDDEITPGAFVASASPKLDAPKGCDASLFRCSSASLLLLGSTAPTAEDGVGHLRLLLVLWSLMPVELDAMWDPCGAPDHGTTLLDGPHHCKFGPIQSIWASEASVNLLVGAGRPLLMWIQSSRDRHITHITHAPSASAAPH